MDLEYCIRRSVCWRTRSWVKEKVLDNEWWSIWSRRQWTKQETK